MKVIRVLVVLMITTILIGCSSQAKTATTGTASSPLVYWPTENWRTSTPEEQKIDSEKLQKMLQYIRNQNFNIDSVLVLRHGYLVFEEYLNPLYDKDFPHEIHSITKTVVTSLIGVAIQRHDIKSLDQKVMNFFEDRTIMNLDQRKESITLRNILLMKSGIEWDERSYSYTDNRNSIVKATQSGDIVKYTLDSPMADNPGVLWNYNGGTSSLLTAIINKATNSDPLDYAKKYFFSPMGISQVEWSTDKSGLRNGGGGIQLTSRDLAKLAYLYIQKGVWDGKQVIPADFATEAIMTQTVFDASHGYGYQSWWTYPDRNISYMAGLNGQRVYIAPDLDLIIVITAQMNESPDVENKLFTIVDTYIIKGCE